MTIEFTDLPDLAAQGAALLCNDEFFAAKENLLLPGQAEWREHEYTDRGKWMDGWETRRRREPGYDWCILRLGMPGIIRGVVVDTKWFRGNFPESSSIDACAITGPLDLDMLSSAQWVEVLPKSGLRGDAKNQFPIANGTRFTHVRLNIFPDGGVARLRVHGEVVPDWQDLLRWGGPIDLAALENGAHVLACSDMFFGSRHNLIKPGRAINMSDGWETKRRRGPGHDWSIVRLGAAGVLRRVEIDTSHFKGNAPGSCLLETCYAPGATIDQLSGWRPLLASRLQPHTRHLFDTELRSVGMVTHARLSVFPDGGVARLRLFGDPLLDDPTRSAIAKLNVLPVDDALAVLRAACASTTWAQRMINHRPFAHLPTLLRLAENNWWQLDEADWLEAFAAHPRIGERANSRVSAEEQAGVQGMANSGLDELALENRAYLDKFGFIYIICASGLRGDDMLTTLKKRLGGTRASELRTAAEEQAKITQLRLRKWANP